MRKTSFLLALCAAVSSQAGESRLLAAALSAVLPGAGQAYLGWRGSAETFLVAEAVVWTGRSYALQRASGAEDAYVAYAAAHAGSDPTIRDRAYYDDMSRYWNSERANQHYRDPSRYTGSKVWEWRSREEMQRFVRLVRDRRSWESTSRNVLGLAILTRAASVIHCLKAPTSRTVALVATPSEAGVSLRW